jgi:hypothetical protein
MHHDEVIGLVASTRAHAELRLPTAVVPHGPCAACEWEQMLGSSQTPQLFVLMLPGLQPVVPMGRLSEPAILRHFDYTSLRAPPAA